MIGPDIIFRHLIAFLVPCGFALMVFLASRVADVFWFRITGLVLAVLAFYFSMMILNRLLFTRRLDEPADKRKDQEPL